MNITLSKIVLNHFPSLTRTAIRKWLQTGSVPTLNLPAKTLHNLPGASTPQQRRTIVHHDVPSSSTALASHAKKTPSFDDLKTYFVFAGLDCERFRHQCNCLKVMLMFLLNYFENILSRRLE